MTIRTNSFFNVMFFRPENEISNIVIFVLGFYFIFNFIIIILFLIYEILSIKDRNSSFNTQTDFIRAKLFV